MPGTLDALARRRRGAASAARRSSCAPASSRTWTSRSSRTSAPTSACAGATASGTGAHLGRVHVQGRERARGGAPWRGRSALDAVELMDIGWNFRREHLRLPQRSHYVITDGGDQPNVVPPNASVWYYFRETDYAHIKEMCEIGNTMAKAAAMMTDTDRDVAHPRLRVAAAHEQDRRRDDVRQHPDGRHADVERGGLRRSPRASSSELKRAGDGARDASSGRCAAVRSPEQQRAAAAPTTSATCRGRCRPSRSAIRRTSRTCRATTGRTRSPMATPIAHKGVTAGAKVQAMTMLDLLIAPRARAERVGLLPQRADQDDRSTRPFITDDRPAGDLAERKDAGQVPAGDEEVLLRPDEVQDVSRAARHQVSDGAAVRGLRAQGSGLRASAPVRATG